MNLNCAMLDTENVKNIAINRVNFLIIFWFEFQYKGANTTVVTAPLYSLWFIYLTITRVVSPSVERISTPLVLTAIPRSADSAVKIPSL